MSLVRVYPALHFRIPWPIFTTFGINVLLLDTAPIPYTFLHSVITTWWTHELSMGT
jgi:hypothetical protein